jgi:2-phospho-L-lactate/phosphoenolpyruvate guanylyltransferase
MRAVLIPVKDLTCAKQRLAGLLSQEERTALARAMLEDVFAAVAAAHGAEAVFVVSSDPFALARACSLGWEIISESHQRSESHSVDEASRICQERGVHSLLRLPIDIPLLEPGDVDALLDAAAAGPSAVLVPSRDSTGTNAILRTPPALFPAHFGPNSLARHVDEARRAGARVQVLRNPRVELDIDDEADLRVFLASGGRETATAVCLRRMDAGLRAARQAGFEAAGGALAQK